MEKLTKKQEVFCLTYVETGNASEAARQAGYSEKVAGSQASENLKKPAIIAYIKQLTARSAEKHASKVLSAEKTLEVLSDLALHGEGVNGTGRVPAIKLLMQYHGLLEQQAYLIQFNNWSDSQLTDAATQALEQLSKKPKQLN